MMKTARPAKAMKVVMPTMCAARGASTAIGHQPLWMSYPSRRISMAISRTRFVPRRATS